MSEKTGYEVTVTGTCVVFVTGAKDHDEAQRMALQDLDKGEFSDTEASSRHIDAEHFDAAKRHADVLVKLT